VKKMTKHLRVKIAVGVTIFLLLLSANMLAVRLTEAQAGREVTRLRYDERRGNGPTLVIRGHGCLQAEDSLRLRVEGYAVLEDETFVFYHCVVP
jgi:hypothetical protein